MAARQTRRVSVLIDADDNASPALNKASESTERLSTRLKVGLAAAFTAVVAAGAGFVKFMASSIKLSQEQERVTKDLSAALGDLDGNTEAVTKSLTDYASELQKSTTFGDEAIIAAQARLAAFVKEEAGLKELTKATADFAAAQGIDIVNAADLLAKTIGSSTNALTRYGLEVEGAAGSSERLSSAVAAISERFGGRAAAEVDTFGGAVKQLGNAFGDLQEQVGDALTKNTEVRESIQDLIKVFSDPANIKAIADFFGTIINGLVTVITAFQDATKFAGEWIAMFTGGDGMTVAAVNYEGVAKQMGITVGELKLELAHSSAETRILNDETREATQVAKASTEAIKDESKATKEGAVAVEQATEAKKASLPIDLQVLELSKAKTLQFQQEAAAAAQLHTVNVGGGGGPGSSVIGGGLFPGLQGGVFTVPSIPSGLGGVFNTPPPISDDSPKAGSTTVIG